MSDQLKQAAQAVVDRWDSPLWKNGSTADAIADLRTALKQQQAEPVAAESITDAMMNLVDRLGSESKQVDLRAWQHLLVYAPQQQDEPVQEPFDDLATELFVVAQRSPADEGFADTIDRIESWLREHFSTPPQRKPLTDEQADQIISGLQTCHHQSSKREFLKVWLRDWAAHGIKEGT